MMEPTIFVVDDDEAVRRAIASAGGLLGHRVEGYPSAEAFLQAFQPGQPGCMVLDIKMSGLTGLELQRRLADQGESIPIIMISGHADVRIAVEAMTLGAITLLEKPFRLDELLGHLRKALDKDRADRESRERWADGQARLAALTTKEREVLEMIAAGKTNREMAAELGLSVRAVEDRRSRLMKKVEAKSIAELVRLLTER